MAEVRRLLGEGNTLLAATLNSPAKNLPILKGDLIKVACDLSLALQTKVDSLERGHPMKKELSTQCNDLLDRLEPAAKALDERIEAKRADERIRADAVKVREPLEDGEEPVARVPTSSDDGFFEPKDAPQESKKHTNASNPEAKVTMDMEYVIQLLRMLSLSQSSAPSDDTHSSFRRCFIRSYSSRTNKRVTLAYKRRFPRHSRKLAKPYLKYAPFKPL